MTPTLATLIADLQPRPGVDPLDSAETRRRTLAAEALAGR